MTLAKAGYGIVRNGTETYRISYSTARGDKTVEMKSDCMKNLKDKWIEHCESHCLNCTCITK